MSSGVASRTAIAPRTLLILAATAVGFAAADTYVVVFALPDMMASVGINTDQLQRGAPIVSGFLLGYIAMLPLIGRIADLRGRVPVLVGSLVVFSIGSLVTAASYDLVTMVIGRFLQGVGGGGLVPATLALVADLWVVEERGLPLGVVGAVQELGSVIGPLYGAIVLATSTWHTIFWINLAVGLVLAAALVVLARRRLEPSSAPAGRDAVRGHVDIVGVVVGLAAVVALSLVLIEPTRLLKGITTGLAFIPYLGQTRWSTAMALSCYGLAVIFVVRQITARRPLINLRALPELARSADVPGAALLGLALAGIVLAFATSNPEVAVFSPLGPWLLTASAIAVVAFGWRQQLAAEPLVPRRALGARSAWGAMLVSFWVGAALIAALVDIPVFARVTTYPSSQLGAALVLVRLLVALPVGALAGGYLLRHLPVALLCAAGMVVVAASFFLMAQWGEQSLRHPLASVALVAGGFGFGLSIAPVNAALLAATRAEVHGLAAAFLVVARMIGMLVGISVLTTIGLRRFYAESAKLPSIEQVCHSGKVCRAFVRALEDAGIVQLHTIFLGAAVCAVIAAALSLLLRGAATTKQSGIGSFFDPPSRIDGG
ncbi:MAG: MFS transporter [Nocardioidaceae bacterium]